MPLYHKDVFLPRRIKGLVPSGVKNIEYSKHALDESKNDRYGILALPLVLDFTRIELIEVQTDGQKADKIVVRHPIDNSTHLVLVLIPTINKRVWRAKTVWANHANDNHSTLNKMAYARSA